MRGREKGLVLDTVIAPEVPRALRGDPGRLRQVLLNLVGNAIKFTDHGGVRVEVTQAGDADGRLLLRFEVIDSGPGIPPEAQHRLFQEFTQVDQLATRRAGGTGLGLAICRKIVTAMRGEIGVHSTLGRGSTFWFTLPLPVGSVLPPPIPRHGLRGLHMLVVENGAYGIYVAGLLD